MNIRSQFAPRDLCERLQKIKCVSHSGFFWVFADWIDGKEWVPVPSFYRYHNYAINGSDYDIWAGLFDHIQLLEKFNPQNCVPAFSQNDFTGATEQARKNAKIVWWRDYVCSKCGRSLNDGPCDIVTASLHCYTVSESHYHRHNLIDYTEGPWWEYLQRTMRKPS